MVNIRGSCITLLVILILPVCPLFTQPSYIQSPAQFCKKCHNGKSVFLAGPVSHRWRDKVREMLAEHDVALLVPINEDAHKNNRCFRIKWEIDHINDADILAVWIPYDTLQQTNTLSLTTIFELGRFAEMKDKPIICGIAPSHPMHLELKHQFAQLRPDVLCVDTFEKLIDALCKMLEK